MSTDQLLARFQAEAKAKYPPQPTITGWDIGTSIKRQAHVKAKMKDAELIQMLVDALAKATGLVAGEYDEASDETQHGRAALAAAKEAGYTPNN